LVKQEGQWSSAVKESKQTLTRLETVVAGRKKHLASCLPEYQKRVQEGNEHADKLIGLCNKEMENKQETVDELKAAVETSESMLTEFKVVVKEMKGLLS
jgi:wobble nucleotide-excising tRNase